jgi:hypothetical protein
MNKANSITRRKALGFGAAAAAALVASPVSASVAKRPTIVELFTSQGCSSCPPADIFMEELSEIDGVIALSYNVDYWDYLGWRDTLGSPAHSQRQYDYAKARGDMDVYTPQMIVDGSSHYVGSEKAAVKAAIRRSMAGKSSLWVPLSFAAEDKEFVVDVAAHSPAPHATLWLLAVAPRVSVKIERGENAGRDMSYCNVTRKLVPAGLWKGEALNLRLPREGVMNADTKGCVVLLQSGNVGPIIGAATWGQFYGEP